MARLAVEMAHAVIDKSGEEQAKIQVEFGFFLKNSMGKGDKHGQTQKAKWSKNTK
jgi:hypothetical protein